MSSPSLRIGHIAFIVVTLVLGLETVNAIDVLFPIPTTLTLSASPTSLTVGGTVTFTVTLTQGSASTEPFINQTIVIYRDGVSWFTGQTNSIGQITTTDSSSSAVSRTYRANFTSVTINGQPYRSSWSSLITVTWNPPKTATQISISSNKNRVEWSVGTFSLNGTLRDINSNILKSRSVVLLRNNVVITTLTTNTQGYVSYTVNTPSVMGTYDYTWRFDGDGDYESSLSPQRSISIVARSVSISVTPSLTKATINSDTVTITVSVSDSQGQAISSQSYYLQKLVGSQWQNKTIPITETEWGDYSYKVIYVGTSLYESSNKIFTLSWREPLISTVIQKIQQTIRGDGVKFKVTYDTDGSFTWSPGMANWRFPVGSFTSHLVNSTGGVYVVNNSVNLTWQWNYASNSDGDPSLTISLSRTSGSAFPLPIPVTSGYTNDATNTKLTVKLTVGLLLTIDYPATVTYSTSSARPILTLPSGTWDNLTFTLTTMNTGDMKTYNTRKGGTTSTFNWNWNAAEAKAVITAQGVTGSGWVYADFPDALPSPTVPIGDGVTAVQTGSKTLSTGQAAKWLNVTLAHNSPVVFIVQFGDKVESSYVDTGELMNVLSTQVSLDITGAQQEGRSLSVDLRDVIELYLEVESETDSFGMVLLIVSFSVFALVLIGVLVLLWGIERRKFGLNPSGIQKQN